MRERLTLKKIERAGPGRHADGGNLYLQVSKTGMKSWVFRYAVGSREVMLGVGPLSIVNLEEARALARAYRRLLLEGRDPLNEARATRERNRAAQQQVKLFKQVWTEFFDKNKGTWSAKQQQRNEGMMLAYVTPIIGTQPVASIQLPDVLRVMEQEVAAHRSYPSGPFHLARHGSAQALRRLLRDIFDHAKARHYRTGDNPAVLPARALPRPKRTTKEDKRHPSMAFVELPQFMTELSAKITTRRAALRYLILTAARTGEVLGARWDEINFEDRLWTVPASRMKTRVTHRVPLSDAAVALLRAQPRHLNNPYIFPGRQHGPLSDRTIAKMQRDLRPGVAVHGYRSSFRTWASEKTDTRHDVIETALSHLVGTETERAYARSDLLELRRPLMQRWADFIIEQPGKVVKLRRRAKS